MSRILTAIILLALTGCVIGRLDSDRLRVIPLSEVHRMDVKPWPFTTNKEPATMNQIIDRVNRREAK
jgi:hypothetical protein